MSDPSLPKAAKQWNVKGFDGPESLVFSEQPVPEIGDTQVLVKSKYLCSLYHVQGYNELF